MHYDRETCFKSFSGTNGETECFISIKAPEGGDFAAQLKTVEARYADAMKASGLGPDTAVFRRVFLSDILNQTDLVRRSGLCASPSENPVAVSIVQQPPLPTGKIALLAYHVRGGPPLVKSRLSPDHVLVEKNGFRHLWSTGLCAGGEQPSAQEQTRAAFDGLVQALESLGGTLRGDCVRTWIYLKNVDLFYKEMAEARRELFLRQGLTADTHYIASTGIEGACGPQSGLVAMDAYSILGLEPRQVSYLNDFDRLCPTKDYNVTFERGTRIAYADRVHYFISGTASIDRSGKIAHPGDVLRQFDRALENVSALLKSGGAGLADMMHMIIYLRDPADLPLLESRIKSALADMPVAVMRGAVCRPGWLVEIEGIAVAKNADPSLRSF